MEQGAFARAGSAAQREKFAARHVEIHAAQDFERALAHGVSFGRGRGRRAAVRSWQPPGIERKIAATEHRTSTPTSTSHRHRQPDHLAFDVRCLRL